MGGSGGSIGSCLVHEKGDGLGVGRRTGQFEDDLSPSHGPRPHDQIARRRPRVHRHRRPTSVATRQPPSLSHGSRGSWYPPPGVGSGGPPTWWTSATAPSCSSIRGGYYSSAPGQTGK